jgi:hypothetical protein
MVACWHNADELRLRKTFNCGSIGSMEKAKAIELLGGSVSSAAAAIGISYQAVDKWPDRLPERISDRVLAALARRHLPAKLIGGDPAKKRRPTAEQAS